MEGQPVSENSEASTTEQAGRFRLPAVDIYETDDSIVLLADMPGVGESGVEVSVDDDMLTILGRIEDVQTDATHREFHLQPYRRVFNLSTDLNTDGVEGRIQKGVLRLTIPMAPEATVRKITIQGE